MGDNMGGYSRFQTSWIRDIHVKAVMYSYLSIKARTAVDAVVA
jgi:hypothetical protein